MLSDQNDGANFKIFDIEELTIPESKTNQVLQIEFTHTRYNTSLCNIRSIEFERTNDSQNSSILNFFDNTYISPNPVSDRLKINSKHKIQSVSFYTGDGRLVKNIKEPIDSNEFDVEGLMPGVYLLRIENALAVGKTFKVLKL